MKKMKKNLSSDLITGNGTRNEYDSFRSKSRRNA